jgi:enterochelin esterase family protein
MRPFASRALRGNRAGDPHEREVPVYLPPGWDGDGTRFPVVFVLSGFTGRGQGYLETHPWRPGVVLSYDRAVAAGASPPAILVLPDCFTRMGGSQYVNSSWLGDYADYVAIELTAFVDAHYPTLPGRRAVLGKSSGGFGALHLAMRHPGVFAAAASVSGDLDFELCYAKRFTSCLRGLHPYGGDPARFLAAFWADPKLLDRAHDVLEVLAMAACYSPNPASPLGFDLPFDPSTASPLPAVFERWLAFDPLRAAERHRDQLCALELLHLECGVQDEFDLQFALRRFTKELARLRIPHVHEEHEGAHRGIDHRLLRLLPELARRLAR